MADKYWETWGNSKNGTKHVIKKRFNSASEAKIAADNMITTLGRGEFQGDLTLPGNPDVVAGAEITLSGFKPEGVNGIYMAKTVNHSISKSGWTTSVHLESLG